MKPNTMKDEIEKVYWEVGEVAKLINVGTHRVRDWSNEFKLETPRNNKAYRTFTKKNIDQIRRIHFLMVTCELSVPVARRIYRFWNLQRTPQIEEKTPENRKREVQEFMMRQIENGDDSVSSGETLVAMALTWAAQSQGIK